MLSKPIHLSETEESGISCVGVKSADLRRNAKSEGSSLGPYRRWSAKAWGANGIRYPAEEPSDAPALLIECQHVAVLSVRREPAPFEFEALSSDDDVELAAEKDSAFRRAARWCGT
ncbi:hypothetical protein VNO77_47110 [Canavalia gladiata]|uniref:Uncharacterized protein n=1 Tax=Canavalia gladiata TaxID=3824 RepID=A0AAN9JH70_CANGL